MEQARGNRLRSAVLGIGILGLAIALALAIYLIYFLQVD
jgi:hypothetical protein